jgi:hypothetical protein
VTINLTFPNPALFGTSALSIPNGERETLTVGELPNGHYEYLGVSAEDNLRKLVGESNPEIIIDD